jgi:crotonobetainyl-CoA:carnitine CoA-transferase CaiB-like acyl-CoA transferase
MIMCNKERFWDVLCDELGHPEWATDPRFATFAARLEHRDDVTRMLDAALGSQTTAHWLRQFAGKVPAAPVNGIAEALNSEFVRAQGRVRDYRYPDGRAARMLDTPIRVAGETPDRAAPQLGAHTEDLLRNLGYDDKRIAELRARGVI